MGANYTDGSTDVTPLVFRIIFLSHLMCESNIARRQSALRCHPPTAPLSSTRATVGSPHRKFKLISASSAIGQIACFRHLSRWRPRSRGLFERHLEI